MTRRFGAMIVAVATIAFAAAEGAAQQVGTIAEVSGTAEIGRAGSWTPATLGAAVQVHDELRTTRPAGMRVVFQDGSVVTITNGSHVIIDDQTFDPRQALFSTALRLETGRIRVLVSDVYKQQGATYDVETVTALSSVHGTEFVMTYDRVAEMTEVVGVTGRVEVHSQLDRVGRAAFVTAKELTRVSRGHFPTPPQPLSDEAFRQYIEGLDFIGGGKPESMLPGNVLLGAGAVAPQLTADALPTGQIAPPVPEAGAVAPGDDRPREGHDTSMVTEQPPTLVEDIDPNRLDNDGRGGVIIRF